HRRRFHFHVFVFTCQPRFGYIPRRGRAAPGLPMRLVPVWEAKAGRIFRPSASLSVFVVLEVLEIGVAHVSGYLRGTASPPRTLFSTIFISHAPPTPGSDTHREPFARSHL